MSLLRHEDFFKNRHVREETSLRGQLHGRVVPAKRVDSLCRVDPLPICIVYLSIIFTFRLHALPGPRLYSLPSQLTRLAGT
jgi:hypothetical protein